MGNNSREFMYCRRLRLAKITEIQILFKPVPVHGLEACARFEVEPHSFLTSDLDPGLSSATSSGCFTPVENVPGTQGSFKKRLVRIADCLVTLRFNGFDVTCIFL